MNLDAIPIFKPNQVLTAYQLNDMREFLDSEDRLTRRALIGVGVACGLELNLDAAGRVHIAKGAAVTSEGYVIAEEGVTCDRALPYEVPLPSGDEATPEQVAEARYPFLFPDGTDQIEAWEMLEAATAPPPGAPPPATLSTAFLADKAVMLFLECTEESLKNCDINDCSDKGAELQFVLRRLLVRRADADEMMRQEATVAGFPTDRASHPGLGLEVLRVEDLGLARNEIATYPVFFARILQIAARFAMDLPRALGDAWAAYGHLLADMYPPNRFPDGPFPDDYFGNLWGNLAVQPYLAQYFYDYMLDAAAAYNEFVAKARAYTADCLPHPGRFPKHVLLGDPFARPLGFVAAVSSPADFDKYDPLAASTGFGPRVKPPQRRTAWNPAAGAEALAELRALFHRLTLLAHCFQLRDLLDEEIRITPSRHGDAPLGARCIPPYYAFTKGSDLFRAWSPGKTRASLLSTVYSHRFSARDADHPYLYRIDGETFYAVAGHVGKDLAQAMGELIVHKRVLGLDFAIEPVWMGLALLDDDDGVAVDAKTRQRARDAAARLIYCRMSDFEVVLLTLLAALFAFLAFILRGVGLQLTSAHAAVPQLRLAAERAEAEAAKAEAPPTDAIGRALTTEDIGRLATLSRIDALRRPETASFSAFRLRPEEREEIAQTSTTLLERFRSTPLDKGVATQTVASEAGEDSVASFYIAVADESKGGTLYDRVRDRMVDQGLGKEDPGAVDRVYNAVALMDSAETLMAGASAGSLDDLDSQAFEVAYQDFADKLVNYTQTAPADPADADSTTASTNVSIADYAPMVAALATTFSAAGLLGEAQRRMEAIFTELTMAGFARRHPGLEHRGGVPKGGTLVLAYASKLELADLMLKAAPWIDRLPGATNLQTAASGLAATIVKATQEVLKSAGPRGEDPLSEFVVLADFCLDSKCCDSDCSDVLLEGALPEDIFDLSRSGGGTEAPLTAADLSAGSLLETALDAGTGPGPEVLSEVVPVAGAEAAAAQTVAVTASVEPAQPEPAGPSLRAALDETRGLLWGRILGYGLASKTQIRESAVVAVHKETGETTRIESPEGAFESLLAPGRYQLVAEAENFQGKPRTVSLEAGGEVQVDLRLQKKR